MNKTLLMSNARRNWKLLLIFVAVLCFYLVVIVSIIDVEDMDSLKELFAVAGGFLDAFGMDLEAMTDVLSYTASTFFTILVMGFTMVYYILAVRRLVTLPIEDGSLAYTLSMPISRVRYMTTQIVYLLLSMVVMFVAVFVAGLLSMYAKASIDAVAYLQLVVIVMLLNMALAVLVLLCSVAVCTNSKLSSVPIALPIALLLLNMVGSAGGDNWSWLSSLSPFGWLDPVAIVGGSSCWHLYLIFGGFVVVGSVASVVLFARKKLPL